VRIILWDQDLETQAVFVSRTQKVIVDHESWVFFRPIVGADQFMSGEADSVAGIQVVNEQVIRLELIQPVAFFLSTLCTEYSYIVPREEVERALLLANERCRHDGSQEAYDEQQRLMDAKRRLNERLASLAGTD